MITNLRSGRHILEEAMVCCFDTWDQNHRLYWNHHQQVLRRATQFVAWEVLRYHRLRCSRPHQQQHRHQPCWTDRWPLFVELLAQWGISSSRPRHKQRLECTCVRALVLECFSCNINMWDLNVILVITRKRDMIEITLTYISHSFWIWVPSAVYTCSQVWGSPDASYLCSSVGVRVTFQWVWLLRVSDMIVLCPHSNTTPRTRRS